MLRSRRWSAQFLFLLVSGISSAGSVGITDGSIILEPYNFCCSEAHWDFTGPSVAVHLHSFWDAFYFTGPNIITLGTTANFGSTLNDYDQPGSVCIGGQCANGWFRYSGTITSPSFAVTSPFTELPPVLVFEEPFNLHLDFRVSSRHPGWTVPENFLTVPLSLDATGTATGTVNVKVWPDGYTVLWGANTTYAVTSGQLSWDVAEALSTPEPASMLLVFAALLGGAVVSCFRGRFHLRRFDRVNSI